MTPQEYIGTDPYGNSAKMSKIVVSETSYLPLATIKETSKYVLYMWMFSNADKTVTLYYGNESKTFNLTTSWQQFGFRFESSVNDGIILELPSGIYYIWHPKLEKGNKPTDWTRAPEDVEAEIQKVDNKLTTNLLKPTLGTTTQNGVTCTNNGDGTYTLSGTSISEARIVLADNIIKNKLSKNLPLKLLGGISNNVCVAYVSLNDDDKNIVDKGTGGAIINEVINNGLLCIIVKDGVTLPNIVVKPMLTTNLNATYDDFVPYTGSTGQINSDVAEVVNNLGAASYKGVSNSVLSGDTNLVTGDAVSKAIFTANNYEEGTFTPKFWNDSNVELTFNSVDGYYKRIGNLCYIYIYAFTTSGVSIMYIDNLPFAPDSTIHVKNRPAHQKGTIFANGVGCFVNVPDAHGQIRLSSVATDILLVEGIYNI